MTKILRFIFTGIMGLGLAGMALAQPHVTHSFSPGSNELLMGVLNHVIHAPLPPVEVDSRFDEDVPCMFYGKEMFSNYLYLLREKNFQIDPVWDQQESVQPGFMNALSQLKIKAFQLENLLPEMQNTPIPSSLHAIKCIESSSDYKSFKSAFTYLAKKKLSKEQEKLVTDIYHLVRPMHPGSSSQNAGKASPFAPIILVETTEENEFCQQSEQVTLVYQGMSYPKITWKLRLTHTLNCGCSLTSSQELSYMSSDIEVEIASTFRSSGPEDLVFIQTGETEVYVREMVCCEQELDATEVWAAEEDSSHVASPIVFTSPTRDATPPQQAHNVPVQAEPTSKIIVPDSSHTQYPVLVGIAPTIGVGRSQEFSWGSTFQVLAPISKPLSKNGKTRLLAGIFAGMNQSRWKADSVTLKETWSYGGLQLFLSSPLPGNVEWLNGLQGTVRMSRYRSSNLLQEDPFANDQMQVSWGYVMGLGLSLGKIHLQVRAPLIQSVRIGSRPEKITDFTREDSYTQFLFNRMNPVEVFFNFRLE